MTIGTCDNCDRQNIPVSHLEGTYCGDTTQCFLCQGDTDPDPYGELIEERVGPCNICGGDGWFDTWSAWQRCGACDGSGDEVVHLEPITLRDLDVIAGSEI